MNVALLEGSGCIDTLFFVVAIRGRAVVADRELLGAAMAGSADATRCLKRNASSISDRTAFFAMTALPGSEDESEDGASGQMLSFEGHNANEPIVAGAADLPASKRLCTGLDRPSALTSPRVTNWARFILEAFGSMRQRRGCQMRPVRLSELATGMKPSTFVLEATSFN